jgi:hypothetical protein
MDRGEFEKELDVWLGDFRRAALAAVDDGCNIVDTLRIAQITADSKANKRAGDRARISGGLTMPLQRVGHN